MYSKMRTYPQFILIFLLILMGCQSIEMGTPPLETQLKATQTFELATKAPANSEKTNVDFPPTQISKTPSPSLAYSSELQLTYISYTPMEKPDDPGFYGVYSVEIGCLEEELCVGEPILLFQQTDRIDRIEWSPDGKKVAYETRGSIFIADPNGKNEFQLSTPPGNSFNVHWSPDGRKLAYIFGSDTTPYQAFVYDLDTRLSSQVIKDAKSPLQFYWITENEILFISNVDKADPSSFQITMAKVDGTVLKQIPKNYKDFLGIYELAISPDRHQFIFSGTKRDTIASSCLFSVNLDSGLVAELKNTSPNVDNFAPTWSPIGNLIAFVVMTEDAANIHLMKPDGIFLRQVNHNSYRNISPAWRWVEQVDPKNH